MASAGTPAKRGAAVSNTVTTGVALAEPPDRSVAVQGRVRVCSSAQATTRPMVDRQATREDGGRTAADSALGEEWCETAPAKT